MKQKAKDVIEVVAGVGCLFLVGTWFVMPFYIIFWQYVFTTYNDRFFMVIMAIIMPFVVMWLVFGSKKAG